MSVEWGVTSEVGPLETVLVHQPGYEHRQTIPWNKDALLFDDILDVEEARPEHREFTRRLAESGARVLYLEDLIRDLCAGSGREAFIADATAGVLDPASIPSRLSASHLIRGYPDRYAFGESTLLQPLPNLYFTRDPAFAVPGALVVSRPAKAARRREARLMGAVLRRHPLFAGARIYEGVLEDPDATLEGGDILVADPVTVMVGVGERTNEAGAEHLIRFLFAETPVERVFKVFIPAKREFMHLDTVMTFVDRRRILTMPHLWDMPEIYARIAERSREDCVRLGFEYRGPDPGILLDASRLEMVSRSGIRETHEDTLAGLARAGVIDPEATIHVAGAPDHYRTSEEHVVEALREQWNDAANTFALKPGQVMTYARNDRTVRALEEAGVEAVSFRGGELVRGRGGARCMTLPLQRGAA